MSDDLVKRLREHIAVVFDDRGHVFENELLCDQAADRIEELEAKLAEMAGIGNKMAQSIEGNYYLPGVAGEWRQLTGGQDE